MPTKPEQGDLLMVLYGRNSESPVPVLAAATPGDCFYAAIEAARVALTYRTPVYLLSDAYLANGAEPWQHPGHLDARADRGRFRASRTATPFLPYKRDPETLARPWAIPGTPGLEHRIGGLEKANETGNVSYDPENHDLMTQLRAQKVAGVRGAGPAGRPPGGRRRARALVGRDLRPGARGCAAGPRPAAARSRTRICAG